MPLTIRLTLNPKEATLDHVITVEAARALSISPNDVEFCAIASKSIDARQKNIKVLLTVNAYLKGEKKAPVPDEDRFRFNNVSKKREVFIVGAGPAGLFAALTLIEKGLKPIIFDRGKRIEERKRDVAALNSKSMLDADSNWCRGEGGAGAFTDGKLYTRSTKRGNVRKVLNTFVEFGASESILIDSHPHIGTDKLPEIIKTIRKKIEDCGGEFKFSSKLTGVEIENSRIKSIEINNSEIIECTDLILACGHSAGDVYELLNRSGVAMKSKPFAVGVRLEHPAVLIDEMQYKLKLRGEYLPPAEYSFTERTGNRGVFSFCMCPGGIIVPASTDEGELVVNGMSNSRRDGSLSNSGFVVEVKPEDIPEAEYDVLAGLRFRSAIERKCKINPTNLTAPAQRMIDFINGNFSKDLPETSYFPGIESCDLREFFPKFISRAIADALNLIRKKKPLFITNSAVLIAPETRTSSPVFILRDRDSFESINIIGLYPCGEGAGYAGGISSSAIDGMNCAYRIAINNTI